MRSRLSLRRPDDEDEADDLRILGRPKSNYAQADEEIVIEYRGGMFVAMHKVTDHMELGAIKRSVLEEIGKQVQRQTPLHYSMNAGRPYQKHLIRHAGKALTQTEKKAAIESLIGTHDRVSALDERPASAPVPRSGPIRQPKGRCTTWRTATPNGA